MTTEITVYPSGQIKIDSSPLGPISIPYWNGLSGLWWTTTDNKLMLSCGGCGNYKICDVSGNCINSDDGNSLPIVSNSKNTYRFYVGDYAPIGFEISNVSSKNKIF